MYRQCSFLGSPDLLHLGPAAPVLPTPLRQWTQEEKGAAQTERNIGQSGTQKSSSTPKPCSLQPSHSPCSQLGSFQPPVNANIPWVSLCPTFSLGDGGHKPGAKPWDQTTALAQAHRLREEANIHFPEWAVPCPAPCTGFLILLSPWLCFPTLFHIGKHQPRQMGTRDRNRHKDGGQGRERSGFQGETEGRRGRPEWESRKVSPRKTRRA